MIYKIKMNKEDYFKINNKLISANVEINGEDVYFEVEAGSYQILKKSNYKYKLIESFRSKILRYLSKYSLIIVGLLFMFSILYMNAFRISKVQFNRETPINDEMEQTIRSAFKKLFFFNFCNLNYEKISRQFRVKYPQYPYINVSLKQNVIFVEIYNYDEVTHPADNSTPGDIVAKKDGIVDVFYVYNGENQVKKNEYVQSGDILISGSVTDKRIQASGLVMATTYEKYVLSQEKNTTESQLTDEKDRYVQITFFGLKFNFGKDHHYTQFEQNSTTTFNFFDFFTIKQIEDTKKDDIMKTYTYEEALEYSARRIEEDFQKSQVNSLEKIVALRELKCEETDQAYTFTFIVKKYESIGVFQSY